MSFAEIAVDAPIGSRRTFTYAIPSKLNVVVGQMVQVPFGTRMYDGIVFQITDSPNFSPARPIELSDSFGPLLSKVHLELACWISDYYLSSLFGSVSLMLPPYLRNRTRSFISLSSSEIDLSGLDFVNEYVLKLVRSRRKGQIMEETLLTLLKKQIGRDKQYEKIINQMVRRRILIRSWTWRIPKLDLVSSDENRTLIRDEGTLTLTKPQSEALQQINMSQRLGKHDAFLLYGVTGSGKTEVYLQALARCLEQNRKGIVLVPEISLTPQMVRRFESRFPGKIAVLHSGLSLSEHRRTWLRIYRGQYQVVIGPRGALFAPIENLGLVVIDEEHEWTYKQQDPEPRYHSRAVALHLARLANSVVILGSATPDIVSYHRAILGRQLRLLELPERVGAGKIPIPLATVEVVDMRKELQEGNRSIFSRALQEALPSVIERGEQAILFINRRGSAATVQCRDCGYVIRCRSCDIVLTYHELPERMVCHQCNRRSPVPIYCPSCGSYRIRYLGIGTQRVTQELKHLIPGISVLRWDIDVAKATEGAGFLLDRFVNREAQVLVGTQMVAKGLHVESVTLVGVILADVGLHLPDFRAGERVFQLLCQVAGRAGRGVAPGKAIVQTYRPDQYAVVSGASQNYLDFYNTEIAFRRSQGLPPFRRLIRLIFTHPNEPRCHREVSRIAKVLLSQRDAWGISEIDLVGPAPAYPSKVRGRYRWHLIIRGVEPRLLLDKIELPNGWIVDVDPVSLM